jgi:hypothetical protein
VDARGELGHGQFSLLPPTPKLDTECLPCRHAPSPVTWPHRILKLCTVTGVRAMFVL